MGCHFPKTDGLNPAESCKHFQKMRQQTTSVRFFIGILAALGVYYFGYHYPETRGPEKIFTKAWAGMTAAHLGSDFGGYFERLRGLRISNQMYVYEDKKTVPTSSVLEYFTNKNNLTHHSIDYYERRLKDLQKLKPREDAKPLVAAAIDLYGFMDEIHKNEFLHVAEMIDSGVPDEEVNDYLEELTAAKGGDLSEKYNRVFELITAYGDRHGIKYSVK